METWDSAGVTVVSNGDDSLPEWTVDSIPFLDIGAGPARAGHALGLAWSSVRLPDGGIAVANGKTSELRFFDGDGGFLRAVGGPGDGPSEFKIIDHMELGRGDTIVVSDAVLPRLSLFTDGGEFCRTIPVDPLEGRAPEFRGLLSDTVVLLGVEPVERIWGPSRTVRDTLLLVTRPLDEGVTHVLGRFPAQERFTESLADGTLVTWELPFARSAHVAVAGDLVWVGVSDTYELRAFSPDGDLRVVVRVARLPRRVGRDERSRFCQTQIAGAQNQAERMAYERVHRILEFPASLPAFSALQGDSEGFVWVRQYALPWEEARPQWMVFDSSGRAVASVLTPAGLTIQEIGRDYILGRWLDGGTAEHVRVFRLDRSGI